MRVNLLLLTGVLAHLVGCASATRIRYSGEVIPTEISNFDFTTDLSSSNSQVWGGGGVFIDSPTNTDTISLRHCKFLSCWNGFTTSQSCETDIKGGGAVYTNQVGLLCDNCRFESCIAKSGYGGAVFCHTGSAGEFITCQFTECKCEPGHCPNVVGGGAVCSNENRIVLQNCEFQKCTLPWGVSGNGGSVLARGGISAADCTFESSEANGGQGGAIWAGGVSESIITDCSFTSCLGYNAGCIWYDGPEALSLVNCSANTCSGTIDYACFYLSTRRLTFNEIEISFENSGGYPLVTVKEPDSAEMAIHLDSCNISATGTQFNDGSHWIAFPSALSSLLVTNCSFQDFGESRNSGGAFAFTDQTYPIEFFNCNFYKLVVAATNQKGGALFFGSINSEVNIIGCTFDQCQSGSDGGAVFLEVGDGECRVENCTFKGCSTTNGQGESLRFSFKNSVTDSSKYQVFNCTFSDHAKGIPIFWKPNSGDVFTCQWTLRECIFVDNTLSTNDGLVGLWSSNVLYDECRFERITTTLKGIIGVCKGSSGVYGLLNCEFVGCTAKTGLIFPATTNFGEVTLSACTFIECSSTDSPCIIDCPKSSKVIIEHCECSECTGPSEKAICGLKWHADLVFFNNSFSLSLVDKKAIYIDLTGNNHETLFENCSFLNNNNRISTYLSVNAAYTGVVFRVCNCTFKDIETSGNGAGLCLQLEREGKMVIDECLFSNLVSGLNGGAISADRTSYLDIRMTTFKDCEAKSSGGAIHVDDYLESGTILDCSFVGCKSAQKGQSIYIYSGSWGSTHDRVSMQGCNFQLHEKDSIIAFDYSSSQSAYTAYVINNCHFWSNTITHVTNGLVEGQSPKGISYEHCTFTDNTCAQGDTGFICSCAGQSELFKFVDCRFELCRKDTDGALLFSRTSDNLQTLLIQDCKFSTCSGSILGISSRLTDLTIQDTEIQECTSKASSLFWVGSEYHRISSQKVHFENITLKDCTDSDGPIIDVICDTFVCIENEFLCSLETGYALRVELTTKTNPLEFENCTFSNNKAVLSNTFLDINAEHTTVSFTNCTFYDIQCATDGAALQLSLVNGEISVKECQFTRCIGQQSGGAIHTKQTKNVNIQNCVFRSCEAKCIDAAESHGGGAVYINHVAQTANIENCSFLENTCANNGQSLLIKGSGEVDTITLSNCSFDGHVQGSIVAFIYGDTDSIGTCDKAYTVEFCQFRNNIIESESSLSTTGVLFVKTSVGVSYQNCTFIDNVNVFGGLIGFNAYTGPTDCNVHNCVFSNKEAQDMKLSCLIFCNTGSTFRNFSLVACEMNNINTVSGILSFEGSTPSENIEIVGCCFNSCSATVGSFAVLHTKVLSIRQTEFLDIASSSPFVIHTIEAISRIEDTLFATKSGGTLIDVTCDADSTLEFYNCCFTHSTGTQPMFMKMAINGNITFSVVCFDVAKDSAISVQLNGDGKLEYDGNEEEFFADRCGCWGIIYSPGAETDTPELDSDVPGSYSETQSTGGQGDGGKQGGGNAGLIAGVVVAVLVVIAVVVVLVLFLMRRRRTWEPSDADAEQQEQELDEEMPATAPETRGLEWGQVTEENPDLKDDISDPFDHTFEEHF